jgi:hypothetical protein
LRRLVAQEERLDADDLFRGVPPLLVAWIGLFAGDPVVHILNAGGIRITQIRHQHRGWSRREYAQPVAACMPGEIDQDVDLVLSDGSCNCRI